jgi:hypothetical protein
MKFNLDQFLRLASVLAPPIIASLPNGQKIAPLVPVIIGAIALAESLPDTPGPQKKAVVQGMVRAGVQVTNASGAVELDPHAIDAIADNGIDAVIGAINETQRAVAQAKQKK